MMLELIMTHIAGVLILLGFVSIIFNLGTGKVTVVRRPVYWLALFMTLVLLIIYGNYLFQVVWGRGFVPQGLTGLLLIGTFLILGSLLILVPYVDRLEFDQLDRERVKIEEVIEEYRNGHGEGEGQDVEGGP